MWLPNFHTTTTSGLSDGLMSQNSSIISSVPAPPMASSNSAQISINAGPLSASMSTYGGVGQGESCSPEKKMSVGGGIMGGYKN